MRFFRWSVAAMRRPSNFSNLPPPPKDEIGDNPTQPITNSFDFEKIFVEIENHSELESIFRVHAEFYLGIWYESKM